jgi:hypothetical protein
MDRVARHAPKVTTKTARAMKERPTSVHAVGTERSSTRETNPTNM